MGSEQLFINERGRVGVEILYRTLIQIQSLRANKNVSGDEAKDNAGNI